MCVTEILQEYDYLKSFKKPTFSKLASIDTIELSENQRFVYIKGIEKLMFRGYYLYG